MVPVFFHSCESDKNMLKMGALQLRKDSVSGKKGTASTDNRINGEGGASLRRGRKMGLQDAKTPINYMRSGD